MAHIAVGVLFGACAFILTRSPRGWDTFFVGLLAGSAIAHLITGIFTL